MLYHRIVIMMEAWGTFFDFSSGSHVGQASLIHRIFEAAWILTLQVGIDMALDYSVYQSASKIQFA